MNIYNLSLPKTGTTSLGQFARENSMRVCDGLWNDYKTNILIYSYLKKDQKILNDVIKRFNYFSDLPFGGTEFFKTIKSSDKSFLIIRDNHSWLTSFKAMVDNSVDEKDRNLSLEKKISKCFSLGLYGFALWARYFFNNKFSDKEMINAKREYEKNVSNTMINKNFRVFKLNDINRADFKNFLGFDCDIQMPFINKRQL